MIQAFVPSRPHVALSSSPSLHLSLHSQHQQPLRRHPLLRPLQACGPRVAVRRRVPQGLTQSYRQASRSMACSSSSRIFSGVNHKSLCTMVPRPRPCRRASPCRAAPLCPATTWRSGRPLLCKPHRVVQHPLHLSLGELSSSSSRSSRPFLHSHTLLQCLHRKLLHPQLLHCRALLHRLAALSWLYHKVVGATPPGCQCSTISSSKIPRSLLQSRHPRPLWPRLPSRPLHLRRQKR